MPTRISGIASGLDTDAIIKQLMQAKRIPIDKMKQQQTKLEWQRDAYRDMNTSLSQLRDAASKMRYVSAISVKKVTTSNDAAVTASGTASAVNGTFSMNVTNLASTAQLTSGALGLTLDPNRTLNSSTLTFTVSGDKGSKTISLAQNATIKDVVSVINAQSASTGVRVSYDATADRMFVNSSATGSQSFFSLTGEDGLSSDFLTNTLKLGATSANTITTGTKAFANVSGVINKDLAAPVKFTVNGVELTIDNTTTIANLNDQLSKSGLATPVYLSLDNSGKVRLESTGAITLGDTSGGLAELGLTGATTTAEPSIVGRGVDATVDFNGVVGMKFHTNSVTFGGVNFTLKGKTAAPFNVTVTSDIDASVTAIKGFVDKYNEVLTKLYDKTHESSNRNYLPLTEDQKAAMKDDEIKTWEAKAKEGLLRNDNVLIDIYNTLRTSVGSQMKGVGADEFSLLSDIGITTGNYLEHGKLNINETKLRDALNDRPDEVANLFTKMGQRYNTATAPTSVTGTGKTYMGPADLVNPGLTTPARFTLNGSVISITNTTTVSSLQTQVLNATGGNITLTLSGGNLQLNGSGSTKVLLSNTDAVDTLSALGLSATPTSSSGQLIDPSAAGLGQRLSELLDQSMRKIADKGGSALASKDNSIIGKQIDDYKDRISKATDRLADYEQKYYSQFAKLESAMEKANSQRNYWASMSGASMN
jgi:flagellar hook-associated protein 2